MDIPCLHDVFSAPTGSHWISSPGISEHNDFGEGGNNALHPNQHLGDGRGTRGVSSTCLPLDTSGHVTSSIPSWTGAQINDTNTGGGRLAVGTKEEALEGRLVGSYSPTPKPSTLNQQPITTSISDKKTKALGALSTIIDKPNSPWVSDGTDISSYQVQLEDGCEEAVKICFQEGPLEDWSDELGDCVFRLGSSYFIVVGVWARVYVLGKLGEEERVMDVLRQYGEVGPEEWRWDGYEQVDKLQSYV
ncbi:hypothetical protein BJ508DRAFT_325409 [Ascobolus immersus RN42]|uniref:Uncharacterized protein n=1 Tax=Ascobolus immersus RN42 TaxID=1160509 RepID=A0A3N4ICL9_ASCIM|nr:hypothetical protein BJ508DRAFT_325409 [Ascobolus immersus RN42]